MPPMTPTSSAPTRSFNTTLVGLVLLHSSASSQPWRLWLCLAALLIPSPRGGYQGERIRVQDVHDTTGCIGPRREEPTPTPASLAEARHSAPLRYQQSLWHPLVGVQSRSLFLCGWTYLLTWRRQTLQPSRSLFYLSHSAHYPGVPHSVFWIQTPAPRRSTSPFVRPAKQSQVAPVPYLQHVRDVSTGERSVAR